MTEITGGCGAHPSYRVRMAEASPDVVGERPSASARPWTQTLIDAAPVAPAWVGVGLAAAQLLGGVLFLGSFGALPRDPLAWVGYVTLAAVCGYAAAATAYLRRGQLAALRRLRPVSTCSEAQWPSLEAELQHFDMARLRRVGIPLAALSAVAATFDPIWTLRSVPDVARPNVVWDLWHNWLPMWLFSRLVAYDFGTASVFARIGRESTRVDLLDLGPLAPYAQRGLQSMLALIGGLSIFSVLFVTGTVAQVAPWTLPLTIPIAATVVLLPMTGVRRSIRAAKHAELGSLNAEIRTARLRLSGPDESFAREAAVRLPALLALREQVVGVREWPVDLSTAARIGLYVAIGLGSWLGAAVVERGLDVVLR